MLKGKLALITGGTRGIGLAVAEKFAREGADSCLFYAGNDAAAVEAVARVRALGVNCACYRVDVSDEGAVKAALASVKEAFGVPDILVNNAGIARDGLFLRMRAEDFRRVVDVDLTGAFLMIRALAPDFLRRRSGRIVNISSVSALMGNAGQANYAAAKAGLIALTKTVARELAPRGITANCVAPGFVRTEMTEKMDQQALKSALDSVPLRRMAEPEEIAEAVAYLAGEGARYVTGTVLKVDGGLYM